MGNVQKRPGGQWRARYRDPGGRERARHFRRRLDAERWLASVESAKHRGEWIDPALARITVGEWAERWLRAQVQLKPQTLERYRRIVRVQVLPQWRRVPLSAVTHADVVAWVAGMQADGYAGATIRQVHRVFSLMLTLAVRDRRLSYNPAEGVRLPRVTRAEPVFLSHAQVDQLAAACPGYELFVRLLAYTGLRWGEAAALQVGRVDLMRRRLDVVRSAVDLGGEITYGTPKTHQRREVPVPRSLVDELATHDVRQGSGRAGVHLAARYAAAEPQLPDAGVRPGRAVDRAGRSDTARPSTHGGELGCPGGSQRQGGATDARARVGGDDAGRLRGAVRRRPGRRRGAAG